MLEIQSRQLCQYFIYLMYKLVNQLDQACYSKELLRCLRVVFYTPSRTSHSSNWSVVSLSPISARHQGGHGELRASSGCPQSGATPLGGKVRAFCYAPLEEVCPDHLLDPECDAILDLGLR